MRFFLLAAEVAICLCRGVSIVKRHHMGNRLCHHIGNTFLMMGMKRRA